MNIIIMITLINTVTIIKITNTLKRDEADGSPQCRQPDSTKI